jgi:preprotein translocase subunit SecG
MVAFLTFIHILNCIGLIIVVLLQAGRGAGMAGVFGASSAGTQIFGGRGAGGFLGRLTAIMAIVFMITSVTLTLARPTASKTRSVVREAAEKAPAPPGGGTEIPGGAPASPAPVPTSPVPGGGETPPGGGK